MPPSGHNSEPMTRQATQRLPWEDRWSQPSVPQLLDPLKAHHRRAFDHLMGYLDAVEEAERSVVWYGPSWKWTIHYTLPGLPAKPAKAGARRAVKPAPVERRTLGYLVPKAEGPMVCLPLSEAEIAELPLPKLSKFVRDGIKLAKCAVAIHWACWSPSTQAETLQIIELLKRHHKLAATNEAA